MGNRLPFKSLGLELKALRERNHETLAEVSGALEIDADILVDYEKGVQKPSEDMLLLLINHFSVHEERANKLMEMAGYNRDAMEAGNDPISSAQTVMVMPMDLRVVYSDAVNVSANDFGVVLNFMQTGGPGNQPLAISRVGMSKEHARSVLDLLQKTLDQQEQQQKPKALPAPDEQKEKDRS